MNESDEIQQGVAQAKYFRARLKRLVKDFPGGFVINSTGEIVRDLGGQKQGFAVARFSHANPDSLIDSHFTSIARANSTSFFGYWPDTLSGQPLLKCVELIRNPRRAYLAAITQAQGFVWSFKLGKVIKVGKG